MDDNKEIIRLLNELNTNVKMLCRITAYSMKKESTVQGKKESMQDQVLVLDEFNLPDSIIAFLVGSTPGSVQNARSLAKSKKSPKPTPTKQTNGESK